MDPITYFPKEINLKIQTHLDRNDAANYCRISHTYNDSICNNDQIWHKLFPEISFPKGMSAKVYLNSSAVKSFDEILERIEQFASTLLFSQKGTFNCLFPFNTNCVLLVKIDFQVEMQGLPDIINSSLNCSVIRPDAGTDIDATCIFMRAIPHDESPILTLKAVDLYYPPDSENSSRLLCPIIYSKTRSRLNYMLSLPELEQEKFSTLFDKNVRQIVSDAQEIKVLEFSNQNRYLELTKLVRTGTLLAGLAAVLFFGYNLK